MKRIFISVLMIMFLTCCSNSEKIYLNPDLENKINLTIASYQKFISDKEINSFDPPIYEITFSEFENECFLTINTNYFYKTDLNGFMFIQNKLVTFNNINSSCNQNLITIKEKALIQNLREFHDEKDAFDNYSPAFWTFKIENGNLIQDTQGKFKIDFTK